MRICILDSELYVIVLDKDFELEKAIGSPKEEKVDTVSLITSSLQGHSLNKNRFYLFSGYGKLKIRLCRRVLRLIDKNGWIPAFFAVIPLHLCEKEIVESFLGFDPDVIGMSDLRWGWELKKLLQRHYPQWAWLVRPEERLSNIENWRKYDPSVKVSIVLPTYNGSKYIRQSIESCLNQTFKNIELIVVDDGSTEDIAGIVNSYNDPRLKYLRHRTNLGVAEALNTGFRNSTGEYLTWTSDDNYYAENAIEEMVRFLQTYPDVDFVYAQRYNVVDEGDGDKVMTKVWENRPAEWLKVDCGIGPCFLYKRKVYETIGNYNPRAFLVEDYDYWIRVYKQFRMQRLFKPLYYYRYHKDSLTARHGRQEIQKKVKLVKELNKMA